MMERLKKDEKMKYNPEQVLKEKAKIIHEDWQEKQNQDEKLAQEKQKERRETAQAMSLFTQLGLRMAACIFVGVIAGKYLDRWLGTSPWLLLIFIVLGAISSFKVLYDMVIKRWEE